MLPVNRKRSTALRPVSDDINVLVSQVTYSERFFKSGVLTVVPDKNLTTGQVCIDADHTIVILVDRNDTTFLSNLEYSGLLNETASTKAGLNWRMTFPFMFILLTNQADLL